MCASFARTQHTVPFYPSSTIEVVPTKGTGGGFGFAAPVAPVGMPAFGATLYHRSGVPTNAAVKPVSLGAFEVFGQVGCAGENGPGDGALSPEIQNAPVSFR